jgi:hypothetical protein
MSETLIELRDEWHETGDMDSSISYIAALEWRMGAMERAIHGVCHLCVHDSKTNPHAPCEYAYECHTQHRRNFQFDEPRFAEKTEIAVPSTAKPAPSIERQFEIKDAEIARLKAQIDWLCNKIGRMSRLTPDGKSYGDPADVAKSWYTAMEKAVAAGWGC